MQSFFKQFQQKPSILFVFFTGNLTLSLPVTCCAGHNIDLASNSNISKTVRVNTVFAKKKWILISFLIISKLIDFAFVVFYLLMFKVESDVLCRVIGISKIECLLFPVLKSLKAH